MTTKKYALLELLLTEFLDDDYVVNSDEKTYHAVECICDFICELNYDFKFMNITTEADYQVVKSILKKL